MKTTDLRIGNVFSDGSFLYKAINIHADGVIQGLTIGNDGKVYPDALYSITNHEGVPLTKEWLLKFGFEKQTSWHRLGRHAVNLTFENIYEFQNIPIKKIDYVHQLQNLYYALTGEELIFSEPCQKSE